MENSFSSPLAPLSYFFSPAGLFLSAGCHVVEAPVGEMMAFLRRRIKPADSLSANRDPVSQYNPQTEPLNEGTVFFLTDLHSPIVSLHIKLWCVSSPNPDLTPPKRGETD